MRKVNSGPDTANTRENSERKREYYKCKGMRTEKKG
jgi:hypothetical protein